MKPTKLLHASLCWAVAGMSLLAQTASDPGVSFEQERSRASSIFAVARDSQGRPILLTQNTSDLKIVIIEGEGGTNNIRGGSATQPVVEVRDRNNNPAAGAMVVFLLPESGPGATFAGGGRAVTLLADANGRATAPAMTPNGIEGSYEIQVQATHQGQTTSASIHQTNSSAAPPPAAETPAPPTAAATSLDTAGQPQDLVILIVEGDGGLNNIRRGSATQPVIEVRDRNNRPVAGAVVAFTLPDFGPSASFLNGSKLLTVTTDASGRASVTGMTPNSLEGPFRIQVTASKDGLRGSTSIAQRNQMVGGGGAGLSVAGKVGIFGAIAATAVVAAVCGSGKCGNENKPQDNGTGNGGIRIGLGSGAPVFGPPR